MSQPITRANAKSLLQPGIDRIFGVEYKAFPEQWSQLFEKRTSKKADEFDVKISGMGVAAEKSEGGLYTYDVMNEVGRKGYKHKVYGLAFGITEEAVDDNLYLNLAQLGSKFLVRGLKIAKEINCASVLNNAFNSSYVGYDGKELCATDHPLAGGGTIANEPSVAVDLSETALESAINDIAGWVDDRGIKICAMAQRVVVPMELQWTVNKLLSSKAVLQPGTANNTINSLVTTNAFPKEPFIYNWLTDPDSWFIMTDVPNGLTYFQRKSVTTGMEGNFDDDTMKYKAKERYSFGFTDYLAVYGCPGA